jgi:hypothetical protein
MSADGRRRQRYVLNALLAVCVALAGAREADAQNGSGSVIQVPADGKVGSDGLGSASFSSIFTPAGAGSGFKHVTLTLTTQNCSVVSVTPPGPGWQQIPGVGWRKSFASVWDLDDDRNNGGSGIGASGDLSAVVSVPLGATDASVTFEARGAYAPTPFAAERDVVVRLTANFSNPTDEQRYRLRVYRDAGDDKRVIVNNGDMLGFGGSTPYTVEILRDDQVAELPAGWKRRWSSVWEQPPYSGADMGPTSRTVVYRPFSSAAYPGYWFSDPPGQTQYVSVELLKPDNTVVSRASFPVVASGRGGLAPCGHAPWTGLSGQPYVEPPDAPVRTWTRVGGRRRLSVTLPRMPNLTPPGLPPFTEPLPAGFGATRFASFRIKFDATKVKVRFVAEGGYYAEPGRELAPGPDGFAVVTPGAGANGRGHLDFEGKVASPGPVLMELWWDNSLDGQTKGPLDDRHDVPAAFGDRCDSTFLVERRTRLEVTVLDATRPASQESPAETRGAGLSGDRRGHAGLQPAALAGDVYLSTGEGHLLATDLALPGPGGLDCPLTRSYRSGRDSVTFLGRGWNLAWLDEWVENTPAGVYVHTAAGRADRYVGGDDLVPEAGSGLYDRLRINRNASGGVEEYVRTCRDGEKWLYNRRGQLKERRSRFGLSLMFVYDCCGYLTRIDLARLNQPPAVQATECDALLGPTERLQTDYAAYLRDSDMEGTVGSQVLRTLYKFEYDRDRHLLVKAVDGTGFAEASSRVVTYGYNASRELVSVTVRGTTGTIREVSTGYAYRAGPPGRLERVIDGRGNGRATFGYGADGRVASEKTSEPSPGVQGGGSGAYGYVYGSGTATVTDRRGAVWTYAFDGVGNVASAKVTVSGRVCETKYEGWAGHECGKVTLPEGNTVEQEFADGRGNLTKRTRRDNAAGAQNPVQVEGFAYRAFGAFNLLETYTDIRGKTTTHSYDGKGRRTRTAPPVGPATEWSYEVVPGTVDPETSKPYAMIVGAVGGQGGRRTEYSYTADYSELVTVETVKDGFGPGNDAVSTFRYNKAGQETFARQPGSEVTHYAPDLNGQTVEAVNDLFGAVEEERSKVDGGRYLVTRHTLDANFNRTKSETDEPAVPGGRVTVFREFDAYDRPTKVTETVTGVDGSVTQLVTQNKYDGADNLVRTDRPKAGSYVQTAYDERDMPVSVTSGGARRPDRGGRLDGAGDRLRPQRAGDPVGRRLRRGDRDRLRRL